MIKAKANVTIKSDTKQWQKMKRNLLRGGGSIRVGWWDSIHPSGEPTAQIAAWNEEGHVNGGYFSGTITPARPFIRTGFIPAVKKVVPTYFQDIHNIAMGTTTWSRVNRKMGEDLVKLMQSTILNWERPPNAPVTIKIKGFNDPLVETGYMVQSVKYQIVAKGSK